MIPKPVGRPSDYSDELADKICDLLSQGKSLLTICRADDMPSTVSVYAWLGKNEGFLNKYTRARETQADALVEEMLDIADESGFDARIVDGEIVMNGEAINRAKLRVDTRKWYASKLAPKKYGDKFTNEHTGQDGGPMQVITTIERRIVRSGD